MLVFTGGIGANAPENAQWVCRRNARAPARLVRSAGEAGTSVFMTTAWVAVDRGRSPCYERSRGAGKQPSRHGTRLAPRPANPAASRCFAAPTGWVHSNTVKELTNDLGRRISSRWPARTCSSTTWWTTRRSSFRNCGSRPRPGRNAIGCTRFDAATDSSLGIPLTLGTAAPERLVRGQWPRGILLVLVNLAVITLDGSQCATPMTNR